MPLFDFVCVKCEKEHHDVLIKNDKHIVKCDKCGGSLQKLISPHNFILNGTGWYKTDFANRK